MEQNADTSQQHTDLFTERLRQAGLRIAARRRERGWSQRELGRQAGLSSSRLSRLERGRCEARLGELIELRNALGLDLDEMVFGRPDAPGSRLERLARAFSEVGGEVELAMVERVLEHFLAVKEART